jgi:hypothetical protein
MARLDADQHVVVPKFVKDRLIRIETRMFDFHADTTKRLDDVQSSLDHLSAALRKLTGGAGEEPTNINNP